MFPTNGVFIQSFEELVSDSTNSAMQQEQSVILIGLITGHCLLINHMQRTILVLKHLMFGFFQLMPTDVEEISLQMSANCIKIIGLHSAGSVRRLLTHLGANPNSHGYDEDLKLHSF
ncbi:hypothetical protein JTB14_012557 [Gonioctena quinquepunctata]|nr:hypothetical protein JTB14_012557 [Gonioctena quinquepunctata]